MPRLAHRCNLTELSYVRRQIVRLSPKYDLNPIQYIRSHCYSHTMTHQANRQFLTAHVAILRASYTHWTGKQLINATLDSQQAIAALDQTLFAVVSHDTQADPIFNYGNQAALNLFAMSWAEFTALPSRLSAEIINQAERAKLLDRVAQHGYIEDYAGIRIAKSGQRFMIRDATIWNLLNTDGRHYGQAALIRQWGYL